jgi:hypothetical protein
VWQQALRYQVFRGTYGTHLQCRRVSLKWHRHREGTERSSETSISICYETVWCQNGTDTEMGQKGGLKHQYLSAYETVWCQNGTDTEMGQKGALKHQYLSAYETVWCQNLFRKLLLSAQKSPRIPSRSPDENSGRPAEAATLWTQWGICNKNMSHENMITVIIFKMGDK